MLHLIWIILRWFLFCLVTNVSLTKAVTMEQFEQSLDMMRNGCTPKFKIPVEKLDLLRVGNYEEVENVADIKCYTKCVAQLAGTVTRKGDFSIQKALAQVPIILPKELQDDATAALSNCKDAQKDYKDSCDRVFYTTKCVRDFKPEVFKFP
ncbi:general odorant-binding protein lush precursor [Stomoxys calcitrans]|uniref:Putative odorant binding protein n=1 Tax=Stomoxys calcitrans TaxID=35570 RepID=D2D0C9_STOCA|nr:general odorant-binding protein lush precursor [Stomoxys calcitrans]ACO83219.1 putative odorant binding protein [Stomoxys calcitrans]